MRHAKKRWKIWGIVLLILIIIVVALIILKYPRNFPVKVTVIPTPTLDPSKIIEKYTYTVNASDAMQKNELITLNLSNSNKTFNVGVGTLFIVNFFRMGNFRVSFSSPQNIFTSDGKPETIHLPAYAVGAIRVYRTGTGKISVIETY